MNIKSGSDSQRSEDEDVHLPEQPSSESSSSTLKPEERSLANRLPEEGGSFRKIKKDIKNSLVEIAETASGAKLSEDSKNILSRFVENSSRGFVSALPMVCKGESCQYIDICPLKAAGSKLPVNSRCPVEDVIANVQISKHLDALNIEQVDDPSFSFDMDMLCELAGLEIIRWRCGAQLAKNPSMTITQMSGATREGEILYREEINPILDVLDKTGRHIGKLREALVATRQAQLEAGHNISDVSQRAAELRAKAEESKKKRMSQLKDAEFTVKNDEPNK